MPEYPLTRRALCRGLPLTVLGLAAEAGVAGAKTAAQRTVIEHDPVISGTETIETRPLGQTAKLTDGDRIDRFGAAVALAGDGRTAIVGAPEAGSTDGRRVGSASLFVRSGDTWTRQARFMPGRPTRNARIGRSVALDNDGTTALVGKTKTAYSIDETAAEGASVSVDALAFVYERSGSTWRRQAELETDSSERNNRLRGSVALSTDGQTALVGAAEDDDPDENNAGSAYVFGRGGVVWTRRAELLPEGGDPTPAFGASVALGDNGNTALVGAAKDRRPAGEADESGSRGGAYVFERDGDTWAQGAELEPDDGVRGNRFGVAVALSNTGDTALVGAADEADPNGDGAGAAYVFERDGDTWSQTAKLVADDGKGGDGFGIAAALSATGDIALVGAAGDDSPDPPGDVFVPNAGSAYLFEREDGTWSQRDKLVPEDGDADDYFGGAAALDDGGDTALLGAALDEDPNGYRAGSAYVFNRADTPTASFSVDPRSPEADEPVVFDASASSDEDGTITTYEWDFDGDGTFETTQTDTTAFYTYDDLGGYTVTLRVTDDAGATATASRRVVVASAEPSPFREYTNDEGVVTTAGLQRAVTDWSIGEITTAMLQEVVGYWASGEPLP